MPFKNMGEIRISLEKDGYKLRGIPRGGNELWVNLDKKYVLEFKAQNGTITPHGISKNGEIDQVPPVELVEYVTQLENIAGVAIETDNEANTPEELPDLPEGDDDPLPEAEPEPEKAPESAPEPKKQSTPKPAKPAPTAPRKILDAIAGYVGNDVLEIFGDTGAGKSKFALEVARQAIAAGKSVYYLDTERNLTEADIASLKGCTYKYTPVLEEIDQLCRKLPKVDVVILDSIGFPVLTSYARLSMNQKGAALLKLIAIFGDLKTWAYKNNGIAIVTNQPESDFNKEKGHVRRPFGDKSQFAAKEIWWTEIANRSPAATNLNITAFRSRSKGHKSKIATMKITDDGVNMVVV